MPKGLLGKKLGMLQVFSAEGKAVPITVVKAGPCFVVQKKVLERDGYSALQLGFEEVKEKKLTKPRQGHFRKAKLPAFRYLREFRLKEGEAKDYEVGQKLTVELFQPGEKVDVTGISKGKGFTGAVKRYGFQRGPMAHGSKYHRRPGALAAKGPARVFKGRKLPGRAGGVRVTVSNLKVVRSEPERNLLFIKGAVPGPRQGLLLIKEAARGK